MKLSIIIPVCNVEQYIGPCLESIYRQGLSDKDFEVIVVNDGSTDNSMKVVEEIQERHKNILIIEEGGPRKEERGRRNGAGSMLGRRCAGMREWIRLRVNTYCLWIPTTC